MSIRMCFEKWPWLDGDAGSLDGIADDLAAGSNWLWKPGQELRICFLDGSEPLHRRVERVSREWEQYAWLKFRYVLSGEPSDIRITFEGEGSWSYHGNLARRVPTDQATMQFGWLEETTSDEEVNRVVLHEFGHALGCVHEHQSPAGGIPWNRPRMYDYLKRVHGWSREESDDRLVAQFPERTTNYTEYDPKSIMHYPIDPELTVGGWSVGWNTMLSDQDKAFIAELYPRVASDVAARSEVLKRQRHPMLSFNRSEM